MRISDWSSDVCSSDLADKIADMLHRPCGGTRRCVAHRAFPIADADHPAGTRDAANLLVGEVAVDLAGRLHPAVARYHRAARQAEDFGDALVATMRDKIGRAHV